MPIHDTALDKLQSENTALLQEINLIDTLTKTVFSCESYIDAIQSTLSTICNTTKWIYAEFWVPDAQGKSLTISEAYYASDDETKEFYHISRDIIFPYGIGIPGNVWKERQPFWSPNVADVVHFLRANYARKYHLNTVYSVPLFTEDEFQGVLLFISRDTKNQDDTSVLVINSISRFLAVIIGQKRLEQKIKETNEQYRIQSESNLKIILALSRLRDPYTANHEELVAKVALAIAEHLGLSEDLQNNLRIAALIHDIGKMAIPIDILVKPSRLTAEEFMLVKTHAMVGYQIISQLAYNPMIGTFILQHHERMNGSGYPFGIRGDAITLGAQILAAADVYVAMSEHRPYRPALGHKKALDELKNNRGILYSNEVVDAFLTLDSKSLLESLIH